MTGKSSLLLIFIDGLGIGTKDAEVNPLAAFQPRVLTVYENSLGPFPRSGRCWVTDAQMGVPGLPQSATGQTALLTGINAPAHLGRHLHGFPSESLKAVIRDRSIFRRLKERGLTVTFANTYTPQFFAQRPRWISVSTVMCEAAGVAFRRLEDLLADGSLYMDFTNRLLRQRGFEVPLRTPAQAANVLVRLTREFDFCFYEYFLTDLVGHRGRFQEAVTLLQELDAFLFHVVDRLDLTRTSLVICSDHGNIEKMDQKPHTTNPVPTLLWGEIQSLVPAYCALSLKDIAPLIELFFDTD